jgi:hypothetical protein
MNKVFAILTSMLLLASTGWAGESATDKPSLSTSQSMMVTANVEAINHETREITLTGPESGSVTFIASEEARNLAQVSVGDTVIAEYVQSMSIEVFANEGYEPGAGEISVMGRSEVGDMPAMTALDALVVTAIVEEINIEANTFKLRGPSGLVKEYEARNPENLKKADVGDIVVITYTQGVAISVEKTAAE